MTRNRLYFIPILRRALEEKEMSVALVQAFRRIREQGRLPEHKTGYEQFRALMALLPSRQVRDTNHPQGPAGMEAERFTTEPGEATSVARREVSLELDLWKDKQRIAVMDLADTGPFRVGGMQPGHYRLILPSGRLLWEADLSARDLFWTEAYPGQPLPAAAQTGDEGPLDGAKEFTVSGGDLFIHVRPGIEWGEMLLRYRGEESQ